MQWRQYHSYCQLNQVISWLQEPVLKISRIKYATRTRFENAAETSSLVFRVFKWFSEKRKQSFWYREWSSNFYTALRRKALQVSTSIPAKMITLFLWHLFHFLLITCAAGKFMGETQWREQKRAAACSRAHEVRLRRSFTCSPHKTANCTG